MSTKNVLGDILVFISYSVNCNFTQKFIRSHINDNNTLGIKFWIFEKALDDGDFNENISNTISSKIKESSLFLVLLSRSYLFSENCKSEYIQAKREGKQIFNLIIDDLKLSEIIEIYPDYDLKDPIYNIKSKWTTAFFNIYSGLKNKSNIIIEKECEELFEEYQLFIKESVKIYSKSVKEKYHLSNYQEYNKFVINLKNKNIDLKINSIITLRSFNENQIYACFYYNGKFWYIHETYYNFDIVTIILIIITIGVLGLISLIKNKK